MANPGVREDLIDSALGNFPVIGAAAGSAAVNFGLFTLAFVVLTAESLRPRTKTRWSTGRVTPRHSRSGDHPAWVRRRHPRTGEAVAVADDGRWGCGRKILRCDEPGRQGPHCQ